MNTKNLIFICIIVNILEWYNFSIYAFLAPIIGEIFFSSYNLKINLLKVFFIFFLSFLIRPIGSIFFSKLSLYKNKIYSVKISILLMGFSTLLIGLLPQNKNYTYLTITLLILLRLIQGFSAGGELPLSACYIYENSSNNNRRFFCSLVSASSIIGILFCLLTTTLLFFLLSKNQIVNWGWRILFIFGGLITLSFVYFAKNRLFANDQNEIKTLNHISIKSIIKNNFSIIWKITLVYSFVQISFYVLFVWITSYLSVYVNVPNKIVHAIGFFGMLILALSILLWGYFARTISKKKIIIFSILSIILLIYPAFYIINNKNYYMIILIIAILAICKGGIDSVMIELMGDIFPNNIRSFGIGIIFTLTSTLFGGTSPFLCSYLIDKTGYILSPIFIIITSGLIALFSACKNISK